ncbi:MAG: S24 family peptidase [Nitrosomonas sp.]|nr:S24 family peptidase [Nitrosomonas sp.]
MMGIRDKLLLVIGDVSINQWARERELAPQTVHGWIKKDRIPRKGGMDLLVAATGIPKEWWLYGKGEIPNLTLKSYPASTAQPLKLVTGSGDANDLTIGNNSVTDIKVNNFATMPKNALQTVNQQGHNQTIHSNQIVDYLAFNKEWLDMSMDVRNNCLALITVKDDSMEPTLKTNDLILTDVRRGVLENNSIYVLQIKNELIVKRIQCKINGNVIVKSDNPNYEPEELDELTAQSLHVIGKVVWYGRSLI